MLVNITPESLTNCRRGERESASGLDSSPVLGTLAKLLCPLVLRPYGQPSPHGHKLSTGLTLCDILRGVGTFGTASSAGGSRDPGAWTQA